MPDTGRVLGVAAALVALLTLLLTEFTWRSAAVEAMRSGDVYGAFVPAQTGPRC